MCSRKAASAGETTEAGGVAQKIPCAVEVFGALEDFGIRMGLVPDLGPVLGCSAG